MRGKTAATQQDEQNKAWVRIDSHYYRMTALSRTAVTIEGVQGDYAVRQRVYFAFVVPVEGEMVEVPTSGFIVDYDQNQMVVQYFAPQPYFRKYLRQAAQHLPIVPDAESARRG